MRSFLRDNPSYHLFGVIETWLSSSISDDLMRIGGFKIYRQDRNLRGGGITLYVRNSLECKILASSNTAMRGKVGIPEYIFCSVKSKNSNPMLVSSFTDLHVHHLLRIPIYWINCMIFVLAITAKLLWET